MLSNKPLPVKAGDNIPLNGRIEVKEWDPDFENADGSTGAYVDVTATQDFTLWAIEADLKNMAGVKVADFSPTISADGLYIGQVTSAVTQTLPAGTYLFDVRIRDANGQVQSSHTQSLQLTQAISETPA